MTLNPTWPAENQANWRQPLIDGLDEIVDAVNDIVIGAGGDVGRTFTQASPASVWNIPFPTEINRLPAVTVRDLAGNVVGVDHVADLATRTVTIPFPAPFAGTATLN